MNRVLYAGALAASAAALTTLVGGCAGSAALSRHDRTQQLPAWQALFDGESLAGWRGYKLEDVGFGWSAEDGEIRLAPPSPGTGMPAPGSAGSQGVSRAAGASEAAEASEGSAVSDSAPAAPRADLMTVEQYRDFELELEWAIGPGGNSGVMFRVSEDQPASYNTGPEMQILDNAGHVDGKKPRTSAASNYALHAPRRDRTKPLGEWNRVRLRVVGAKVDQWLNGKHVVSYRLGSRRWEKRVTASKFRTMPRYGRNATGHIVLQDHGDPVRFRNLRIRVLGK